MVVDVDAILGDLSSLQAAGRTTPHGKRLLGTKGQGEWRAEEDVRERVEEQVERFGRGSRGGEEEEARERKLLGRKERTKLLQSGSLPELGVVRRRSYRSFGDVVKEVDK